MHISDSLYITVDMTLGLEVETSELYSYTFTQLKSRDAVIIIIIIIIIIIYYYLKVYDYE